MTGPVVRRFHGERGATLILTVAFLVIIGGISSAVVASVTTSFKGRVALDRIRDQQYAADGGVEYAIAQVRNKPAPGPGLVDCGDPALITGTFYLHTLNGIEIRVDCANQSTILDTGPSLGLLQRNVIFTACLGQSPCTPATTIIRAQVNYQGKTGITRTWVQSWSVNR